MKTPLFDYHLPPQRIAQQSVVPRDQARLMVLDRRNRTWSHHRVDELPNLLEPTDVLVFNNSKVIPARLIGNKYTGGKVELLLTRSLGSSRWLALTKPGLSIANRLIFDGLEAIVVGIQEDGQRVVEFDQSDMTLMKKIEQIGIMPTPPYVKRLVKNPTEYQTIYAKVVGSVAAPTAGFHFTPRLLDELKDRGFAKEFVTLHVGLGTFLPVKTDELEAHEMHEEQYEIPKEVAARLNLHKQAGHRIIAIGTTTVRTLESAADEHGRLTKLSGWTKMFIHPGFQFKFVDGILTNFHLPKSTLLILVSAFAGRDFVLAAYQEAVDKQYRFYSFGDAMLVL